MILHLIGGAGATSIPQEWVRQLSRQGLDVEFLSVSDLRPKYRFWWPLAVLGIVWRLRPELIHVHHSWPCFFGFFIHFLLPRSPVCVSVHRDFTTLSLGGKIAHFLSFLVSDYITVNSRATYESLPEWTKRRRVKVVYNGVNCDWIGLEAGVRVELIPKNWLFVGRLIPEKNVSSIVHAIHLLSERSVQVDLIVIGDGPERERLVRLAETLGVSDSVNFLGSQERSDVYRWMGCRGVLVVPSFTEGYCNVAVEGLAAGMLVIHSPCKALVEVVKDAGILMKDFDAEAIVDCFSHVNGLSKTEIADISCLGQARASEMSILDTGKAFEVIYNEMLEA